MCLDPFNPFDASARYMHWTERCGRSPWSSLSCCCGHTHPTFSIRSDGTRLLASLIGLRDPPLVLWLDKLLLFIIWRILSKSQPSTQFYRHEYYISEFCTSIALLLIERPQDLCCFLEGFNLRIFYNDWIVRWSR